MNSEDARILGVLAKLAGKTVFVPFIFFLFFFFIYLSRTVFLSSFLLYAALRILHFVNLLLFFCYFFLPSPLLARFFFSHPNQPAILRCRRGHIFPSFLP
jgi:hypothetical protein